MVSNKAIKAATEKLKQVEYPNLLAVYAVSAAQPVIIAEVVEFLKSEPGGDRYAALVEQAFP